MRPKLPKPLIKSTHPPYDPQDSWRVVVSFFIALFLVGLVVTPVFVAQRNEDPRPAIRKVRLQTPSGVKSVRARVWGTRSGLVIEFVDPIIIEK